MRSFLIAIGLILICCLGSWWYYQANLAEQQAYMAEQILPSKEELTLAQQCNNAWEDSKRQQRACNTAKHDWENFLKLHAQKHNIPFPVIKNPHFYPQELDPAELARVESTLLATDPALQPQIDELRANKQRQEQLMQEVENRNAALVKRYTDLSFSRLDRIDHAFPKDSVTPLEAFADKQMRFFAFAFGVPVLILIGFFILKNASLNAWGRQNQLPEPGVK